MLKPASKNIPIKQKTLSVSCGNCTKLTEIEGQKVCFENGKITRLIEDSSPVSLLKMYCNAWQKDKTKCK